MPTFVFHEADGHEIGRIVQDPVESLEQDTRTIIQGGSYETAFPVAKELITKLKTMSVEEIHKELPRLVEQLKSKSVGEGELRTFGYVMWTSFQLAEAELLFELNTLLYPESVDAYLLLIQFKYHYGRAKEAKFVVRKALKLAPDNAELLEWKQELRES